MKFKYLMAYMITINKRGMIHMAEDRIWIQFLQKHWKMVTVISTAAALAVIGAIYVLVWFVGNAQATGLIPRTLALWSVGTIVMFLLNLILWEILYIAIPVIIFVIIIYLLWWKKIPAQERQEYHQKKLFGKRSRSRDGGSAFTFFLNIGVAIKVYLDGNWNVPISTWTFNYLIVSYLWVLFWILVIFGIPILLGGIWWLHREVKKESRQPPGQQPEPPES